MSYGLIELTFVFGAVLALGLWEFFGIRREIARSRSTHEACATRLVPHHDGREN